MFYKSLSGNKVVCNLCARRCKVAEGELGFCRVRKNVDGKLFTLVYGLAALNFVDLIEKKSLFHFYPGSSVYSICTDGCNFRCKFCINWQIRYRKEVQGQLLPPAEVVALANQNDCQGISYTYTEPTVFFEYAYDTARLAHEKGLFNNIVTNSYMSPEAVQTIAPYLDAATVDFKGGGDPVFYKRMSGVPLVEPIFECLSELKKHGVHIEVTNLIVPGYGDSIDQIRSLTRWIRDNLGPETPLHFLRFRVQCPLPASLPSSTLDEKAYKVALEEGLHYVYTPDHTNTYCPNCHELLVERAHDPVTQYVTNVRLNSDNTCPNCGGKIPFTGACCKPNKCVVCGGVGYPPSALGSSTEYWGYES
jgi:pyruvate formate lyase activating enzyme